MLQNTIQFFLNILFNLKKYYNNNVKLTIINTVKFNFLFLIIYFLTINSINIYFLFIPLILYILFTLYLTYLIIKITK